MCFPLSLLSVCCNTHTMLIHTHAHVMCVCCQYCCIMLVVDWRKPDNYCFKQSLDLILCVLFHHMFICVCCTCTLPFLYSTTLLGCNSAWIKRLSALMFYTLSYATSKLLHILHVTASHCIYVPGSGIYYVLVLAYHMQSSILWTINSD